MDSALIDAEPGILTSPTGVKFVFAGGITAAFEDSVQPTPADVVENAGDTWDDVMVKISGTPAGEYEGLTTLFPYLSYRRSQNIYGADAAWTIHTTSGRLVTFHRGAVTGYPTLFLSPEKTIFGGGFEVTAIRKNNVAWSAANSLYTEAALAFTDWSYFDAAAALKVDATAAWGAVGAPWNGIETEEGWEITPQLNLKFQKASRHGTVQAYFVGDAWMAKCRPLNVGITEVMAQHPIQGTGARRGKRIASGNDLVLTGEGGSPVVTLTSAQIRRPGYNFGNEVVRVGELGFEAQRTYHATTGAPLALVSIE